MAENQRNAFYSGGSGRNAIADLLAQGYGGTYAWGLGDGGSPVYTGRGQTTPQSYIDKGFNDTGAQTGMVYTPNLTDLVGTTAVSSPTGNESTAQLTPDVTTTTPDPDPTPTPTPTPDPEPTPTPTTPKTTTPTTTTPTTTATVDSFFPVPNKINSFPGFEGTGGFVTGANNYTGIGAGGDMSQGYGGTNTRADAYDYTGQNRRSDAANANYLATLAALTGKSGATGSGSGNQRNAFFGN